MDDPRVASNFLVGAQTMKKMGEEEHNGEPMIRYEGSWTSKPLRLRPRLGQREELDRRSASSRP